MKKLIWDLPIRLFHWLFVGSVIAAFLFAQAEDEDDFYLHVVFGVLLIFLLIWRVIWGFTGSSNEHWSEFFKLILQLPDYIPL